MNAIKAFTGTLVNVLLRQALLSDGVANRLAHELSLGLIGQVKDITHSIYDVVTKNHPLIFLSFFLSCCL